MPAFRVSGSTGQAPTTAWFGSALPDRGLTIAMPGYHSKPDNGPIWVADNKSATFISDYVPFNPVMGGGANADSITLGSAVTAPDGTSTANHIVETAITNFHAMTAIFSDAAIPHSRRIAVIAQAAERSRMFVAVCLKPIDNESGCRTVFDLAGGQIGVVNTRYGTDTSQGSNIFWSPISQSIKALGGGWYLCIMDIQTSVNITGHNLSILIGPDAGSGTGALNISYAGDVTKGINVWKTNVLPPRAWSMQNTVFFNDMDSLTKFDLNNTKAPGFDFYMNYGDFPLHGGGEFSPLPASAFSVSSSILTLDLRDVVGGGTKDMSTVSYLGSGNWTGNGWIPPAYIESRFAFETARQPQSNGIGFYGIGAETLVQTSSDTFGPNCPNTATYCEIDYLEVQSAAGGNLGIVSCFGDQTTRNFGAENIQSTRSASYAAWNPVVLYHVNAKVGFNGVLYISLVDPNTGNQPDLTVGVDWDIFTPPAGQPTSANTFIYDGQAQNTYGVLWLPDHSMYGNPYDVGEFIGFINDHLAIRFLTGAQCMLAYGRSEALPKPFTGASVNTAFVSMDRQHMPISMGSNLGFSNLFIDYVRVTQ